MLEQSGLGAFFSAEHDEEGGQQGNKGGQDGPAGKKRGEQAAEHSPGDEGADQSIVDPDLLQRGPSRWKNQWNRCSVPLRRLPVHMVVTQPQPWNFRKDST